MTRTKEKFKVEKRDKSKLIDDHSVKFFDLYYLIVNAVEMA